jgi:hypothetical protein
MIEISQYFANNGTDLHCSDHAQQHLAQETSIIASTTDVPRDITIQFSLSLSLSLSISLNLTRRFLNQRVACHFTKDFKEF